MLLSSIKNDERELPESDKRCVKLCTVASGYPLYKEVGAPFVPIDDDITECWGYDLWNGRNGKEGGDAAEEQEGGVDEQDHDMTLGEYMNINAFTKEGMIKVAKANNLVLGDDFFGGLCKDEDCLHDCFIKLSLLVHEKGNYKNVHVNFIEGMHRQMAWTHAIYGAEFNSDGIITPNTLRIQHFADAEFKIGAHGFCDDAAFRKQIRKRFFNVGDEQFLNVPLTIYYVNKAGADGEFMSNAFVHMSKLHSESKRDSNTRCPWQTLGVEAEKFVTMFQYDNIVLRPDFHKQDKFVYPKQAYKVETDVEDDVENKIDLVKENEDASTIVNQLYRGSDILNSEQFQCYIKNPYSSKAKSDLIQYLETDAIDGNYNIANNEELKHLDKIKNKKIQYPFNPTYKSMTEDVGSVFKEGARINTMMANNLIHYPLVLTILWESIKGLSRHDTLLDQSRVHTIEYYLRFHNDPDENQTNLNLHGVYNQVYSLSQATNMYSSGAEIIGAAHIICQMWNVFVAVQTESCLGEDKKKRAESFRKAGGILKRTFTNIGDTVQSMNNIDVVMILGKCSYCNIIPTEILYYTKILFVRYFLANSAHLLWELTNQQYNDFQRVKKNTYAQKGWLRCVIFYNNLHRFTRLICTIGVFPKLNDMASKLTPSLHTISKALSGSVQDTKKAKALLTSISNDVLELNRKLVGIYIRKLHIQESLQKKSLLLPMLVHSWVLFTQKNRDDSVNPWPGGYLVDCTKKNSIKAVRLYECLKRDPDDTNEKKKAPKGYISLSPGDFASPIPLSLEFLPYVIAKGNIHNLDKGDVIWAKAQQYINNYTPTMELTSVCINYTPSKPSKKRKKEATTKKNKQEAGKSQQTSKSQETTTTTTKDKADRADEDKNTSTEPTQVKSKAATPTPPQQTASTHFDKFRPEDKRVFSALHDCRLQYFEGIKDWAEEDWIDLKKEWRWDGDEAHPKEQIMDELMQHMRNRIDYLMVLNVSKELRKYKQIWIETDKEVYGGKYNHKINWIWASRFKDVEGNEDDIINAYREAIDHHGLTEFYEKEKYKLPTIRYMDRTDAPSPRASDSTKNDITDTTEEKSSSTQAVSATVITPQDKGHKKRAHRSETTTAGTSDRTTAVTIERTSENDSVSSIKETGVDECDLTTFAPAIGSVPIDEDGMKEVMKYLISKMYIDGGKIVISKSIAQMLAEPINRQFPNQWKRTVSDELQDKAKSEIYYTTAKIIQHIKEQKKFIERLRYDVEHENMTSTLSLLNVNTFGMWTSLKGLAKAFGIPEEEFKSRFSMTKEPLEQEQCNYNVSQEILQLTAPLISPHDVCTSATKNNLKIIKTYDVTDLYKAMDWAGELSTWKGNLTSLVIKNTDLNHTVLCFRCDFLSEYYTYHQTRKNKDTTDVHTDTKHGQLHDCLQEWEKAGWIISLDFTPANKNDNLLFVMWSSMYDHIRKSWNLVQTGFRYHEHEEDIDTHISLYYPSDSNSDKKSDSGNKGVKRKHTDNKNQQFPTFDAPSGEEQSDEGSGDGDSDEEYKEEDEPSSQKKKTTDTSPRAKRYRKRTRR